MPQTILALDLGTSYFKLALFNPQGSLLALHKVPTPTARPAANQSQIPADAFRQTIWAAIKALLAKHSNPRDIGAITFSTQANSFLLLDAQDRPLTPIILWTDTRGPALPDAAERIVRTPLFRATTGMPMLPLGCAPAKLHWLRQNQPEAWNKAAKFCLISDYLTYLLTRVHATEAGTATLLGMVDVVDCRWWPQMVDAVGVPREWLPKIVRAGTDLGPVLPSVASELGLSPECRFVVGCLDQYAGAIGVGNVRPGGLSETTGTVLATVQCSDVWSRDLGPDVFQGPAFRRGLYYRMSFGETSANLLEAYRERLPGRPEFEELIQTASLVPPGAQGLRLRAGIDPSKSPEFDGVTKEHTPAHFVRAILEGVALALTNQVGAIYPEIQDDSRLRPAAIVSAGGAARSDLWLQIKADTLGFPVWATACEEPTSLGAAALAGPALGWGGVEELIGRWVTCPRKFEPKRA